MALRQAQLTDIALCYAIPGEIPRLIAAQTHVARPRSSGHLALGNS